MKFYLLNLSEPLGTVFLDHRFVGFNGGERKLRKCENNEEKNLTVWFGFPIIFFFSVANLLTSP